MGWLAHIYRPQVQSISADLVQVRKISGCLGVANNGSRAPRFCLYFFWLIVGTFVRHSLYQKHDQPKIIPRLVNLII
jgi:hypothetical protein